jgi:transcriptional regulator with XRE-family HTH domain
VTLLDSEIKQRRLDFGLSVKALRKKAGLSQEKLAQIAEIDRKSISRVDILWAIADALKKEVYELFLPMAHGLVPRELELKPLLPDQITQAV